MDGNVMGWLAWLVIGGVAGWLASIVMKTNRSQGMLLDIIVGIVGAFLGGFLFNLVGAPGVTGFNIWSVLVAFIGAIVLLGLIRMFNRSSVVP
jgi:uncharacterized membrane protein YeaQ/YmgE (transglycosylase-associated protein family)